MQEYAGIFIVDYQMCSFDVLFSMKQIVDIDNYNN